MIPALIDLMGAYYQAGNLSQMEAMARSILAAIPEDIVALQFLGLALHRSGRTEAAYQVLGKVARKLKGAPSSRFKTTGELASTTVYRQATCPTSGLGEAWLHIAQMLRSQGFRLAARQAWRASRAARGGAPVVASTPV